MTTVEIKLMIIVCHLLPFNLVCNRHNFYRHLCEKKYCCSCVIVGRVTTHVGVRFWVAGQKGFGNTVFKRMSNAVPGIQ